MAHDLAGPFALGRFATSGGIFTGLVAGERVCGLGEHSVAALLADWEEHRSGLLALAESSSRGGPGDWHALADLRVLAPVEPGQVLQSGANYKKHVIDLVMAEWRADHEGASEEDARVAATAMMDSRHMPYIFIGLPSAITGPYDDIVLPRRGGAHDWELELAVVIGREAWEVAPEDAMEYVGGYTIGNDLTTRDVLYRPDLKKIGTDWLSAKNAPTFLPTGPFVVPAEFVKDPMDLRVTLTHNGVVRQDESTSDMIFDIAELLSYTSHRVRLRPGDLLLTGSPAGNGAHWGTFMKPGDVIRGEITGLGFQNNVCKESA